MKEMYLKEYTYEEIVEKFDCSSMTIAKYLKEFIKENPRNYLTKKKEFLDKDIKKNEINVFKGNFLSKNCKRIWLF